MTTEVTAISGHAGFDVGEPSAPPAGGWLVRFALHRPALRAWAMYDWANSAVWTSVIAAIFPVYFYTVAGAGLRDGAATSRFALATTLGLVLTALLTPLLGAIADVGAVRKKMLAVFMAVGVAATAGLFFVGRGDWVLALALFVAIEVGLSGGCVFYDSLLPHVARGKELDTLSTTAYALGYLGGGLLLALNLAWMLRPGWFGLPAGEGLTDAQASLPARLAFVSAAVWWLVFSVPLFRRVPEPLPQPDAAPGARRAPLAGAFARLREVVSDLRRYPQAFRLLVAFLIYSDGVGTIIRMAAIYGTEIGIGRGSLIASILLVQFVGIPFSLLFGGLANRVGPKPAVLLGLVGYVAISVYAYFIHTAIQFLILALGVAVVQGGTQALSRSLFATLVPKSCSAEFFSFFALSEKFAGFLGPAVFAVTVAVTGSSRSAIVSVVLFFVVGGALLLGVNVERGRRDSREPDAAPDAAPQAA